ncbi:septal ring lytic transglycosylase RlpA family protein [Robertkochia sediminum]|uniref:septal ring lytic transglycosylase RlpA family protein n=1 Tax=Robertkochia sediminum TaxID=2785326 RepID=UPI001932AF39|nr:septal ring lytic transglycosylase RlpA family protein [Robertkochia sediminum]MBL7473362.1 septal ring lytic transglycosylase RlpA family protein [Robertkochia sediminum]
MNAKLPYTLFLFIFLLITAKSTAQETPAEGMASYYSDTLEGRSTASGEPYQMALFTAAHRTLPFNTRVKVTNLSNLKTVIVRINDRGPFVKGRIIDVSRAVAEVLGIIEKGVVNVRIEVVED